MESKNVSDNSGILENEPVSRLVVRSSFGGTLMGLANLVPGISGGTMLLISGIYPAFIEALASVTRLRFSGRSLLVLGSIGIWAGLGILVFAGLLRDLVLEHRWVMYSLFIGLTLGGLPVVWKMARPSSTGLILAAIFSFGGMIVLDVLKARGIVGVTGEGYVADGLAGTVAAVAMVLPGISGAYLLMLMGKYLPILASIDQFKHALTNRDVSGALEQCNVLVPVGIGVAMGILITGNLLKWLLQNYPKFIFGILIGLLLGSISGLYPFQEGVPPQVGNVIKSVTITPENIVAIERKDWPIEYRQPKVWEAIVSLILIVVGFAITQTMVAIGNTKTRSD